MRLLLGISLLLVLCACGSDPAETAGPTASGSVAPSVSLDADLAKAAEDLAGDLEPTIPTAAPSLPPLSAGPADTTISADPDDYTVDTDDTSCDAVWSAGRTLPSPYHGCSDGDVLVAAEGKQRADGIYFSYDGLCGREGGTIRRC